MLSIQKTRELLPDGDQYTDEQLTQIRDEYRCLAQIVFEQWTEERRKERKQKESTPDPNV